MGYVIITTLVCVVWVSGMSSMSTAIDHSFVLLCEPMFLYDVLSCEELLLEPTQYERTLGKNQWYI